MQSRLLRPGAGVQVAGYWNRTGGRIAASHALCEEPWRPRAACARISLDHRADEPLEDVTGLFRSVEKHVVTTAKEGQLLIRGCGGPSRSRNRRLQSKFQGRYSPTYY
jgi:hypothetical protein